jgi:hypothetical protein
MKKLLLLSFLFFTLALTFCKKGFPDDPLAVGNFSVTDCKTKGDNTKGTGPEYITIKTVDDYYLLFNHINSIFNCEPGQITVSIEIKSDTIFVDEGEESSLANCTCPYDLEFRLGPLHYGDYPVRFQKYGTTFKEYSLNYNKSTDVRIDIHP